MGRASVLSVLWACMGMTTGEHAIYTHDRALLQAEKSTSPVVEVVVCYTAVVLVTLPVLVVLACREQHNVPAIVNVVE